MSRRALRRLRGEQRGQEPLGPSALQFVLHDDDDVEEECPKRGPDLLLLPNQVPTILMAAHLSLLQE
ncbi:hypothetical protein Celaphus_00004072, partial [Cervus elaphus hippelaphus]